MSVGPIIEACRAEGRAALIGYLPVGFPTVDGSIEAMEVLVDRGVDIIEIGVPYSDPVMDGPVIQDAAVRALEGGVRLQRHLRRRRAASPQPAQERSS